MPTTGLPPKSKKIASHADLLSRFQPMTALVEHWAAMAPDRAPPYHTVNAWKRRDNVPPEYWPDIERAARELEIRGVSVAAFRRIANARGELKLIRRRNGSA